MDRATTTARRTSPRRISAFQQAVRAAMDRLMREHGYSRERAVTTLLQQLTAMERSAAAVLSSRPNQHDPEIFQLMQTYGLGMEQAAQMWKIAQAAIQHEQEESTRRHSKKFKPMSCSSSSSSALSALEHFTRKLETVSSLELDSKASCDSDRIHDEDALVSIRTPLPSIAEAPAISASPVTTAAIVSATVSGSNAKPMTVVGTTSSTKLGMDRSSGIVNKSNKKSKTGHNVNAAASVRPPQPPPLPSVITTTTTATTHAAVGKTNNNNTNNNKRNNSGERPPTPPQNPKRTRRASSVSLNNNVAATTAAPTTTITTTLGTTKPQPAE